MYSAILKINDNHAEENEITYKGKGETIFDALGNIPRHYTDVKTKGVIEVSDGSKKAEKFFVMKQLRMLLVNDLRRSGWAKQFEALLK